MTDEQIKQNADIYADKLWKGGRCTESTAPTIQEIYIAGAHSRDEEIECIKNEATAIMDEACALTTELDKLRNPWISVEKHPDDVTREYLLEYEDGSHIIAMWDSGMWMSENLHPLKEPTCWMPIPELKKGE